MSLTISKRRIQKLGGSSLIITIPKSWAKKIGLTVGDTVIIVDEGDHLKILPPDTSITQKVGIARIKISGFLKEVDTAKVVDCSYQKGYTRIELQLSSNGKSDIRAIAEELKGHPKVKSIKLIDHATAEVELEQLDNGDVTILLKKFNTKLQDIIDIGEATLSGSKKLDEAVREIEERADEAYNIVDSITRLSFRQGIVMCEFKEIDPTILVALKIVARLLERAVKNLINFPREESIEAVRRIRILTSEAIGGIASGSGRRIANSLQEWDRLKEVVDKIRMIGTPEAQKVATCVESLGIAMETLASKGICSVIENGS
ncbi:MAG: AbrB/MazE/SpoVT family DNA-binding domain-containing protein [Desulfurococcales archaeon]|nr:AbrB/MazE/SpoVT family DNA-binding domain-containing protein [Desulfurococcales archaeon]